MSEFFQDNPYAAPTTTPGPPLGQARFYGLVTQQLNFSTIYQLSRHPLVWLYWILQPWLTRPRDRFTTGIVNPLSPADLQIDDLERHIRERLSEQHPVLVREGFQFAGFYNGPTFGLAKNLGELWYDEHTICINLLVQVVSIRRGKKVSAIQVLLTRHHDQMSTQTTNSGINFDDDSSVDTLLLPGTELSVLIHRHRDRIRPKSSMPNLNHEAVWQEMWQKANQEVQKLEKRGLLTAVTENQLESLIAYSQFIDFRECAIPWIVRVSCSLKLPLYLWLLSLLAVMMGYPSFRWAIYGMPAWWFLNNLISFPLYKFFLQPDPYNRLPPCDYFYYLRR